MLQSKWATPPPSAPAPFKQPGAEEGVRAETPAAPPLTAPEPDAEATERSQASEVGASATTLITHPQEVISQPLPTLDPQPSFDGAGDEFAQTRPPDDLFSDDFEPIPEAIVEESSKAAQQVTAQAKTPRRAPRTGPTNAQPSAATAENKPQGPEGPRTEAVRGDRSGTGGVKKTKLTEAELSARMEAIKLKNQSLEAAHARAEADEASFNAREAEAQQKRKLERQNRQQMMGERERNRQRKMNALGGREWDATKDEEELAGPARGSQYRRGANGGVVMDFRPTNDMPDGNSEPYEDRARGGRGRGGRGRGQGRGGRGNGSETPFKPMPQSVPTPEDFPSLPASNAPKPKAAAPDSVTAKPAVEAMSASLVPATNGTSWAEEMENPAAATTSA